MSTIGKLEYEDWRSGQKPISTTLVSFAAGLTLPKRSLVALKEGATEYSAFNPAAKDGSEIARYILVEPLYTTGGVKAADVYDMGTFNPELIAWPDAITEAQKAAVFSGSPISLKALTEGS